MDGPKIDDGLEVDVPPLVEIHLREVRKDRVREKIALRLTSAMICICVAPIIGVVIRSDRAQEIHDVAGQIIPAVSGILGAVIGFYFGEKR